MPTLIPALFEALGLDAAVRARLARALDRKDAAEVATRSGNDRQLAATLTDLLFAAGPMAQALSRLAAIALPPPAAALAERLAATAMEISARVPGLRLTVDPVEFRGFRYHTGVAATVYAPGRHEELGRGGRYVCGKSEPATG